MGISVQTVNIVNSSTIELTISLIDNPPLRDMTHVKAQMDFYIMKHPNIHGMNANIFGDVLVITAQGIINPEALLNYIF